MTVDAGELAADRIRLRILRRTLGEHLATYRRAAGVSQPELSQAMGRTRTTVSKVEHGTRGMPEASWRIADDVCGADGALIAEYQALVPDLPWRAARPRLIFRISGGRTGLP